MLHPRFAQILSAVTCSVSVIESLLLAEQAEIMHVGPVWHLDSASLAGLLFTGVQVTEALGPR